MQSKTPISGAGVQIALRNGGTSGRFEVAQVAARLFPNQSAFVERIVAEGTMPKSDFPVGPYPHDVIRRRTVRTVEFETSPNEKGMGTESLLVANADPIVGVAIMPVDEDNSLVLVDVRLPLDSKRLTSSILQETQRRYDHGRDTGPEPSVNQIYEATRLKHFDQAQKMMDRVLRDHPESAKAHYVQAEIYAAEGHRDLARSELARAEELKPGLPDVNPRSVRQLRITLGLQGN
jgi:tetratricopeptide (TPR) repeat protein